MIGLKVKILPNRLALPSIQVIKIIKQESKQQNEMKVRTVSTHMDDTDSTNTILYIYIYVISVTHTEVMTI